MKPSSLILLTTTILLCLNMVQPKHTATRKPPKTSKPGFCPEYFVDCPFIRLPLCKKDKGCKGNKKCCFYDCQMHCMEPWISMD
uniref:WAP four-disulfide core domain 15A n=1 Tax=Cricetulus griseus TaxID=10029 RepID=A0A8C2M117_CRIGR